MSVFSTEVDKRPLTGQLCILAFNSKDSACPSSVCGLWVMDGWLALLSLSINICQMRDAVGALRAVTEALKELTLCGYVWASLLLTLISGSLDYSGQAQSPVISTTELVGKLWPGQMKPLAQGCGAIPGSARHE